MRGTAIVSMLFLCASVASSQDVIEVVAPPVPRVGSFRLELGLAGGVLHGGDTLGAFAVSLSPGWRFDGEWSLYLRPTFLAAWSDGVLDRLRVLVPFLLEYRINWGFMLAGGPVAVRALEPVAMTGAGVQLRIGSCLPIDVDGLTSCYRPRSDGEPQDDAPRPIAVLVATDVTLVSYGVGDVEFIAMLGVSLASSY